MSHGNRDHEIAWGLSRLRLTSTLDGRFRMRLDGADGPDWIADFGADARLRDVRVGDRHIELTYAAHPGVSVGEHGSLVVSARVELETLAPTKRVGSVAVSLDAPADFPMADVAGPTFAPVPDGSRREDWRYLIPDGEGLWVRSDGSGPGTRQRVTFHDHRITLPMVALVNSGGASLMISAIEGHDHAVALQFASRSEDLPGLGLVSLPAFGTWRYRRQWTISALPTGAVSAIAAELSRLLIAGGYPLRSQREKLVSRGVPEALHGSVGGTLVWCHFDTLTASLVGDLSSAGLEAVMVMGRPADAAATAAIARAGYATGPYFQTYDVYPTDTVAELGWRGTYPPEGPSDGWPQDLIHDSEGWLDAGWGYLPFAGGQSFWRAEQYLTSDGRVASRPRAVHNETAIRSYRRCPSCHRRVLERHGLPLLDRLGSTAVFYDIVAAMWGLECYSPAHPVDRRDDVAHRKDTLRVIAETGRILHSEAGKWWAIDEVNAFEGLFSYDQELDVNCIQLTDYPSDPLRREFEFNLEHRVPLFGMVARHAVARTMWWGTGQDRHADTWASKDAITALYGANPIYVVDPDHPLTPGTDRWATFEATTLAFDQVKLVTESGRIASYETATRDVARTVFENGSSVEANVGLVAHGGLGPGQFILRDPAGKTVVSVVPPTPK